MKKLKYLLLIILILPIIGIVSACQSSVIIVGGIEYPTTSSDQFEFDWLKGEITKFVGTDKDVVVPSRINGRKVVSIGEYAFNEAKIDSVILPDTITNIGMSAFRTSTVKSVYLPDSVKDLGEAVFFECRNLTNIVLPQNLTYINNSMFAFCDSLTNESFSIPNSVSVIGSNVFNNCQSLTSIQLPDGLQKIGENAFNECSNLESIVVPQNVTVIESRVFNNCSKLRDVQLSSNLKIINNDAFNGCISLEKIDFPSTLTSIGSYAFNNCEKLYDIFIPSSVTNISEYAFSGCVLLTDIILSNNVNYVGLGAFSGCTNLTIFCEAESQPATWDINWNISNCTVVWRFSPENSLVYALNESGTGYIVTGGESGRFMTKITIPDTYEGLPVVEIGHSAFLNYTSLNEVIIPSSIVRINVGAFNGCISLKEVKLPNGIQQMDDGVFAGCTNLRKVNIPTSLMVIDAAMFGYCTSLSEITIPTNIQGIGPDAFLGCSSLKQIIIPDSVTIIKENAFKGCSLLTTLSIPQSVSTILEGAFSDCTGLLDVVINCDSNSTFEQNIFANSNENLNIYCSVSSKPTLWDNNWNPDNRNVVWNCNFVNLNYTLNEKGNGYKLSGTNESRTIKKIVTPLVYNNLPVTEIAESGFENALMDSFVILRNIKTIGDSALSNCMYLHEIMIPNSVENIAPNFIYASILNSISVEESNKVYDSRNNCNAIIKTATNELIKGCDNTVIPNNITSFADYSFNGCDIKTLTISSSVVYIGKSAFSRCDKLESIVVEEGNKVYNSNNNCNAIIETASQKLVKGCDNTIIPYGVKIIGENAFAGCSFTTINIPSTVTIIEDGAFYSCLNLTNIDISHVTNIGGGAFIACFKLENVVLSDNLQSIGTMAFKFCDLTRVTLPITVTTIESQAFDNNSSLYIYCEANSKPSGWADDWASGNENVIFGYIS